MTNEFSVGSLIKYGVPALAVAAGACSPVNPDAAPATKTPGALNVPGIGIITPTPAFGTATETEKPAAATKTTTSSPTPPPTIQYSPTPGLAKTESATPAAASEGIQYLTKADILYNRPINWLEIGGKVIQNPKNSSISRGDTYAHLTYNYGGHEISYLVASVVFHKPQTATSGATPTPQAEAIPVDKFPECKIDEYAKCDLTSLQDLKDGSFAAWIKQQYGEPNSDVAIALIVSPEGLKKLGVWQWVKNWATGTELDFVTDTTFDGQGKYPDPVMVELRNARTDTPKNIEDFAATADSSYLDGQVFETEIHSP